MIDPVLKRVMGQMTYGVQVVACAAGAVVRGHTATWVCRVSFEEPIVVVSVSPRHDTTA